MTTRIFLKQQFIPRVGNPVFQIREELDTGTQVIQLDPRNPSPEELTDVDEAFAATQQLLISELQIELDELKKQLDQALTSKASIASQLAETLSELEALKNPPFDPRVLHPHAFLNRFVIDERIAILNRSKSDPLIGLILSDLQTVSRVRLDADTTRNGINYLLQVGIIDQSRASEVLRDAAAEEQ